MTTKFSSAMGRFRVAWHSQYNGGQKRERRKCAVRIPHDLQIMLMLYQNVVAKLTFTRITYNFINFLKCLLRP